MTAQIAPGFLVAAPSLTCPFFNHSVVLLVDHREEGSFGFVVNRPAGIRFRQVLGGVGLEIDAVSPPEAPVMVGGPVGRETGWVLYDPRDHHFESEHMVQVSDELVVTASFEMLQALAEGRGPSRRVMCLGYSGWGPGQLDAEVAEGSWIPVDLDPRLIFDSPIDRRWTEALQTLGIEPGVVGSTVADA